MIPTELIRQATEQAELEKDAARYRWLLADLDGRYEFICTEFPNYLRGDVTTLDGAINKVIDKARA